MGPFALLAALHKAGFAQDLHVIGKAGLGQPQVLVLQHAGALFAAAQPGQNGKALFVAQGAEHRRLLTEVLHAAHLKSNFLDASSKVYTLPAALSTGCFFQAVGRGRSRWA